MPTLPIVRAEKKLFAVMNKAEIEAALNNAFLECSRAFVPLTDRQKEILLSFLTQALMESAENNEESETENPLDELTPEERKALLEFVREQQQENRSWKIQLLNDWLRDRPSGSVQFIRDSYGPQWLNRVKPVHLATYFEQSSSFNEGLRLKVGDRVEVCNRLWEWVQEDKPETQEWFPCTVIAIYENREPPVSVPSAHQDLIYTNCIIRFENGAEFEIQGIYQWNRYNWRWSE